ncbi:hypothetical protein CRUP_024354 [Coryphaenoides rupestris]|nr:hypothetical protein CRUP_024354 [Coryphaenoides rupestris]
MDEDLEAQEDELLALGSIFGPEVLVRAADDGAPSSAAAAGELRVSVELPQDFFIAVKDGDALVYFGISSLPPLTVRFELPEDYPSSAPPSSTLTCGWLTHTQIYALNTHLADLYQATGGAVVLFSWVQFLKEDTLSFLDINSLLVLPSDEHSPTSPHHPRSPDCRATQIEKTPDDDNYDNDTSHLSTKSTYGSDRSTSKKSDSCSSASSSSSAPAPPPPPPPPSPPAAAVPSPAASSQTKSMLSAILVHDKAAKQRRFADSVLDCGVCLAPVLGSQCMVFRDCGHVHCEPCLAQFCTVQIKEGNWLLGHTLWLLGSHLVAAGSHLVASGSHLVAAGVRPSGFWVTPSGCWVRPSGFWVTPSGCWGQT